MITLKNGLEVVRASDHSGTVVKELGINSWVCHWAVWDEPLPQSEVNSIFRANSFNSTSPGGGYAHASVWVTKRRTRLVQSVGLDI